jgi:hypothetical protein
VSLYNSLSESTERPAKLAVLKRLITLATEARQLDLLASYLHSISRWRLEQGDAATLYLTISTCYQKLGAGEEEQHFLIKYLSTFEGAPAGAMAAATHAARSAAINYLKAPAGSQKYDVPRLQAVSAARPARRACAGFLRPPAHPRPPARPPARDDHSFLPDAQLRRPPSRARRGPVRATLRGRGVRGDMAARGGRNQPNLLSEARARRVARVRRTGHAPIPQPPPTPAPTSPPNLRPAHLRRPPVPPQVKSLAKHPQHGRLYELVDIFAHKELAAFIEWCGRGDNMAYLTELGACCCVLACRAWRRRGEGPLPLPLLAAACAGLTAAPHTPASSYSSSPQAWTTRPAWRRCAC